MANLKTVVAVGPLPPVAANTSGEKQVLSTSNTLIIYARRLALMKMVTLRQWGTKIGALKRVKHPDIEKRTLPIPTPKISSNNI